MICSYKEHITTKDRYIKHYIVEFQNDNCTIIYRHSLEIVMKGCCQSLWGFGGGGCIRPKKKDMMFLNMFCLHNQPFTFACVFLFGGMGPTPSSQSFSSDFVKAQTPFTFQYILSIGFLIVLHSRTYIPLGL